MGFICILLEKTASYGTSPLLQFINCIFPMLTKYYQKRKFQGFVRLWKCYICCRTRTWSSRSFAEFWMLISVVNSEENTANILIAKDLWLFLAVCEPSQAFSVLEEIYLCKLLTSYCAIVRHVSLEEKSDVCVLEGSSIWKCIFLYVLKTYWCRNLFDIRWWTASSPNHCSLR